MPKFMQAPTLETERLRLRARTLEDFPFFADLWADQNVTRYIGGEPQSEETTWTKFLRMIGHWPVMGFGYWAVEEKATGALIGDIGFGDFKRDIEPSLKGDLEAGWVLAPAAFGKGYASEGLHVAIDWAKAHFPDKPISCIIDPDNAPSIRLAEKFDFQETARATYHGEPTIIFYRQ